MWSHAVTHVLLTIIILLLLFVLEKWYRVSSSKCTPCAPWPGETIRVVLTDAATLGKAAIQSTKPLEALRLVDEAIAMVETLLRLGCTTEQIESYCHVSVSPFLRKLRNCRQQILQNFANQYPDLLTITRLETALIPPTVPSQVVASSLVSSDPT